MKKYDLREAQIHICGEHGSQVEAGTIACGVAHTSHAYFRQEMLSSSISNQTNMRAKPAISNSTATSRTV
ncbi:hypothetical protein [Microbulbifer sp. M83]|uniref:hypothetical protein n=1 Tax=Microbulbifer sp. M83 TaxID=3118246 RepID=UPI002FDF9994